jgi:hypothetical protein
MVDSTFDVAERTAIAEPAPRHEFRARRHRRRLIELEHRQTPGDVEQTGRFGVGIEELRSHRDPPCIGT